METSSEADKSLDLLRRLFKPHSTVRDFRFLPIMKTILSAALMCAVLRERTTWGACATDRIHGMKQEQAYGNRMAFGW